MQTMTAARLSTCLPIIADALNSADGMIFPNSVVDGILMAEAQTLRREVVLDFEVCIPAHSATSSKSHVGTEGVHPHPPPFPTSSQCFHAKGEG